MQHDYTIIGWRAWYTEGRQFNSTATKWSELPSHGALCFVLYSRTRPYRRVMTGVSLYWHDPKTQVYACDNRADALIPTGMTPSWVKRGKWTDEQEYREVMDAVNMAMEAPNEKARLNKGE